MPDDHVTPCVNPGPKFRSRLEQDIADELDAMGLDWQYEQPVVLPDGTSPRYLPDFLIVGIAEDVRFDPDRPVPRWIEGKPQQFIYDLRDSLGVTRQYGDRFAGRIDVPISSDEIKGRHIEELWKPKRLAELTGQTVLVIGGVGGINRLTVEMHAHGVIFDRSNWIANYKGHQQRLERAEARWRREQEAAEWRAYHERQQAERAARAAEQEAERRMERERQLKVILSFPAAGANRYPGACVGCGSHLGAMRGNLRCVALTGGGSRWFVVCTTCEARHG